MQLNSNGASAHPNAISARPGSGMANEIELYEELLAFVEMTPEEQSLYLYPAKTLQEDAGEVAPIEAAELDSSDPVALRVDSITEPPLTHAASIQTEETLQTNEEIADQFNESDPLVDLSFDSVPFDGSGSPVDSSFDSDPLDGSGPPVDSSFDSDPLDGSGPLVGVSFDSGLADTLSGTVCPVCEAKSAIDELFCMSCGSFLNGIASTSPSNPTCADCNEPIAIDEIFCPWCGSVLAG
jgi:hypothetical protein